MADTADLTEKWGQFYKWTTISPEAQAIKQQQMADHIAMINQLKEQLLVKEMQTLQLPQPQQPQVYGTDPGWKSFFKPMVMSHPYADKVPPLTLSRTSLTKESPTLIPAAPEGLKAFMTGSRVYGTPRPDSDHDMVIRCNLDEQIRLENRSDHDKKILFGNLNIITCIVDWQFNAWYEGTQRLTDIKPVTRAFAIEVFTSLGLRPAPLEQRAAGAYPTPQPVVKFKKYDYAAMQDKEIMDDILKPQYAPNPCSEIKLKSYLPVQGTLTGHYTTKYVIDDDEEVKF